MSHLQGARIRYRILYLGRSVRAARDAGSCDAKSSRVSQAGSEYTGIQVCYGKLETPIAYLDAPEFQKFWQKDAKMLADAIKRVGKVEIPEAK